MNEYPFLVSVLIDMGNMSFYVYAGILWASDESEATRFAQRDAERNHSGVARVVRVEPINTTMLDRFRTYVNGGTQRTVEERYDDGY